MASKREELARKYGLDQQAGNQPSGSRLEQMNQQYGITKQGSSQTGAGNHLIESLAQKYGISQQTGNGSKRDELAKKYGLANAPVVDEKFLNQFQNNVKLYSHGYQRAIEGMNAGNYDKLFALWDDKRNNISNQSYQIRQWMDAQDWTGNEAYQEQLKGYLDEVDQFSANTRLNLSQNRDAYQAQKKHDRLTGYDLDGAQGELEGYQEQLKRYMGLMDQKDIDALQEKIQATQRDIEEATEYQSWYRTQDAYYEGLDVEATTETVAQLRQEVERLESEYDHMWDEFQHNPNQTVEEYDRLLEQEAQYEQTLAQKKNRIAQLTADSRKATDYRAAQDMATISNRQRLAEVYETLVSNKVEQNRLNEYKENIDRMEAMEQQLDGINREIRELSSAKGKRDTERIDTLRKDAEKLSGNLSIMDGKLLRIEASSTIRKLMERKLNTRHKEDAAHTKETGGTVSSNELDITDESLSLLVDSVGGMGLQISETVRRLSSCMWRR